MSVNNNTYSHSERELHDINHNRILGRVKTILLGVRLELVDELILHTLLIFDEEIYLLLLLFSIKIRIPSESINVLLLIITSPTKG